MKDPIDSLAPASLILVIEDDPVQGHLLTRLLHSAGHPVELTTSAEQGLELVQEKDPGLVLMDVELQGGINGHEAVRRLRQLDGDDWRPVMMVTARDSASDWEKAVEAGADDYLVKPIVKHQLLHKVAILQRLYRAWHHHQQARKLQALGQVAAGVAHDFNNLLQVIKGNVQLLHETFADSQVLTAEDQANRLTLEDIAYAVNRGQDLVEHLSIYADNRQPLLGCLNLKPWLISYAEHLARLWKQQYQLDVQLRIDEQLQAAWVHANQVELERVLDNLTRNALLAIQESGQQPAKALTLRLVKIGAATKEPAPVCRVRLSVEDRGVGMDKETRRRLFEPFYTTRDVWQGFGLGLAQVESIIRRHKGCIQVTSSPGVGSRFDIDLPLLVTRITPAHNSKTPG